MQLKPRFLNIILFLSLVFLFTTCETKQDDNPYIAKVGPNIVSIDEFVTSYTKIIGFSNKSDSPQIRKLHANKLVEKKLLASAARDQSLQFDENIVQQVSLEKEKILKDILFKKEISSQKVTVIDSTIREHFRWKNSEVYIRHFFHQDFLVIDSLARIIRQDTILFIQEAKKQFQNPELKESGGLLGWIPYNILDPQLEEAAFSMPVGHISKPVQSSFGWHLILKQNEKYNPILSEDEYLMSKTNLENIIYRKKYQIIADQYVNKMIASAEIEIHDSLFYFVNDLLSKIQSNDNTLSIQDQESELVKLMDLAEEEIALINGNSFSVNDFLTRLQTQPPNIVNNNLKTGLYRIIRDQLLLKKAEEFELEEDPVVLGRVRDIEDNYYASLFLRSYLPDDSTHISSHQMKYITDSLSQIYPVEYNQALLDTFILYLESQEKH